jgi:hypothetical protein
MANPGDKHIDVFERLLRYLLGTRDLGLVYTSSTKSAPLVTYSDSSHMDCVDTSRSTLAYICFFFGQPVSWYSKLHSFVTTCSNHSEYAAMFHAAKEAQSLLNWVLPLLEFLQIEVTPIPIFNDNDGASALARDPVGRFKNKHVKMEHHYTQELVAAKIIVPIRVDTSENKSDLLTKALGPTVFPPLAHYLVGLIPEASSHKVLMFRATNALQPPVTRVYETGTQCAPETRDVATQCEEDHTNDPNAKLYAALRVVKTFSQEMCAVSDELATQQKNMLNAASALYASLDELKLVRPDVNQVSSSSSSSSAYYPGLASRPSEIAKPAQDVAPVKSTLTFSPPFGEAVRRAVTRDFETPCTEAKPASPIQFRPSVEMPAPRLLTTYIARSPREATANSRARHFDAPAPSRNGVQFCSFCNRGGHTIQACRSHAKHLNKSLKRGRHFS